MPSHFRPEPDGGVSGGGIRCYSSSKGIVSRLTEKEMKAKGQRRTDKDDSLAVSTMDQVCITVRKARAKPDVGRVRM